MDISLAIKKGYFQALSPEIGVPIYDSFAIPENATYPYVIISDISVSERVNTGCKIYDATVTLDVVTAFTSPTGMNQAFEISGEIDAIVNPARRENLDLNDYGWTIGQTRTIGSTPSQLRTGSYWVYRNILVYNHIVWPFTHQS